MVFGIFINYINTNILLKKKYKKSAWNYWSNIFTS